MSAGERLIIALLRMILRVAMICAYRSIYPETSQSDYAITPSQIRTLDEARRLLEVTKIYE